MSILEEWSQTLGRDGVPPGVGDGLKGLYRQNWQAVPTQQGMRGLLVSSDLLLTPPACTSYLSGMLEMGHLLHEPHLCLFQALVQAFMLPPAFPELQETVLQHLRAGILSSSLPCPLSRGQSPTHWCNLHGNALKSHSCCSVAKSCLTLCEPMDCSTPGFPVPHHLLELAQTHPLSQ